MKKQVKTLFLLSYDSTRRRRYYTFTSVCIIFEYFVLIARKYDKQHRLSIGSDLKVCYTCYKRKCEVKSMNPSNKFVRFGLKKAFDYVGKNPDENLPNLMDWVDNSRATTLTALSRRERRSAK